MVVINECSIDYNGKCLVIEASTNNLEYYKNVNIAAVIVDTQDTFIETGPSNRAIYHVSFESKNYAVDTINDCSSIKSEENCKCANIVTATVHGNKHIRLAIPQKDLEVSLNDNIFFVYVVTNGIPSACTPCGMDNMYTMAVAVNLRPIYNHMIKYVKELDNTCNIPRAFIDSVLRLKAFELSLKTGNWPLAFKQWKALSKQQTKVLPNKGCGCGNN